MSFPTRIWINLLGLAAVLSLAGCGSKPVSVDTGYDFLLGLDTAEVETPNPNFVHPAFSEIADVPHWGIYQHAPSTVTFRDVYVGEQGEITFSIGILPGAWNHTGDGVRFEISAIPDRQDELPLYSRYIDPKSTPEHRAWLDETVSLAAIKNTTAAFIFKTRPGAEESSSDNNSDWAVWGNPQLTSSGRSTAVHPGRKTNVLLITVDTLRADYLSCYGNPWIETPTIDYMAKNGVLFENCYAASSTTLPSHASILTSLRPYEHGVINNNYRLAEVVPRLPQIMRENGYKTGAAISVYHLLNDISGLGEWFDWYEHVDWRGENGTFEELTRPASATTNAAIGWLEKNHGHPFFLWVHYYDPHTPYEADGEFHRNYYPGDPRDPAHQSMADVLFHQKLPPSSFDWIRPYTDLEYFKREYGAEISYMDFHLSRLLFTLENLGLDQNTLVALTADHGENLGDHAIYFDHWTMYNSDLHVPLILFFPGRLPAGTRVKDLVTHIDIAPTLLDLLGDTDNFLAKKMFEGISLRPLWEGKTAPEERIFTADGLLYTAMAGWDSRYKVIWELRDAVYHDRFHLEQDRVWILDRSTDPLESNPAACFYWGDESERQAFQERVKKAAGEIMDVDEEAAQEEKLLKIMELTRQRAGQKKVPSPEELLSWTAGGKAGVFLKEVYQRDPEFLPRVLKIMTVMRDRVSPPPLKEKLRAVMDITDLEENRMISNPLFGGRLRDALQGLDYVHE
ncbi:MAG: sulfatase-like hydrolase/transferase [bacterium]